uniref:N-acetyltransferase domain-containing protein n=1 Tax=Loa loa TaxID=7209 RepID=A0A1I7W5P3_LOALO
MNNSYTHPIIAHFKTNKRQFQFYGLYSRTKGCCAKDTNVHIFEIIEMISDEEKQELRKESMQNDDYQEITAPGIIYTRGGKEDFVSFINASNETNGWTGKYRDYDCYRKMLGPAKLHDVAARTKIGDYVGSCICLEFDTYAFVSLYYIHPEYRKRGIGTELFKRVINDDLRKKNIGLHSVQHMSAVYSQQLGFNKWASWTLDIIEVKNVDKQKIIVDNIHLTVKDGKEVSLQRIIDYDAKVAKCRREDFVMHWAVDRIDAICKVLVNSKGEILGYGCGRLLSVVGYPGFGPVYSDSDDGFKLLFYALCSCFDNELKEQNSINLHVPTIKSNTVKQILHDAANFKLKEQLTPQFTQEIPGHDIDKIYCVTDATMFI